MFGVGVPLVSCGQHQHHIGTLNTEVEESCAGTASLQPCRPITTPRFMTDPRLSFRRVQKPAEEF